MRALHRAVEALSTYPGREVSSPGQQQSACAPKRVGTEPRWRWSERWRWLWSDQVLFEMA